MSSISAIDRRSTGPTYAFAAIVLTRVYSLICGRRSEETVRYASGNRSATIAAARRSCTGFRKDQRKQIATDSTPCALNLSTASTTSASFRGLSTLPSEVTRSSIGTRRKRGTSIFAGGN